MSTSTQPDWLVKGFIAAWIVAILFFVGLGGGLIWVVAHFIAKAW